MAEEVKAMRQALNDAIYASGAAWAMEYGRPISDDDLDAILAALRPATPAPGMVEACSCGKCLECDAREYHADMAKEDARQALTLIRAMLSEYDGEPTHAGEAFKIADAALRAKIGSAGK